MLGGFVGELRKHRRLAGAERLLRDRQAALAQDQQDGWEAHVVRKILGELLRLQKKYDEAERLLLKAYDGIKSCKEAKTRAGHAQVTGVVKSLVRLYEDTNQAEQAANWRHRAEANADAYDRGDALYSKGAYDKAITEFSNAIREDATYTRAYVFRGLARLQKGQLEEAIADFTEAIRLEPTDRIAHEARGVCWNRLGKRDNAIADFTESIRLDPYDAAAYCERGNAWYCRGEFEHAIEDWTAAIRLDPKRIEVYCNRGEAYRIRREYDKAAADVAKAIATDAKNGRAYVLRAAFWQAIPMRNIATARRPFRTLKRARQLITELNGGVCQAFAAAYAEAGNFVEAMRWQQRALEDPRYANYSDAQQRLELYRNKQPYRLP